MKTLALVLIILIVAIQYEIWFGTNGVLMMERLEKNVKEQKAENTLLENQNIELRKEINALRNSPELLEEVAREQLGLVKPNETFYRIIPQKQD